MSPQHPHDTTSADNQPADHTAANAEEPSATLQMCQYCFHTVIRDLSANTLLLDTINGETTYMGNVSPTLECPLFITWDKKFLDQNSVTYVLRGCIGSLSPCPLITAVRHYALTSALRDTRFDPVKLEEVPNLRVGVSLLIKYENCDHVYDWQIGIHGILIKFHVSEQYYSATYLPEVASDQRWTQGDAVKSLIRKAGYRGTVDNDLLARVQCTRYQSSKCRLTYEDYVESLNGIDPLAGSSATDKEWCIVT